MTRRTARPATSLLKTLVALGLGLALAACGAAGAMDSGKPTTGSPAPQGDGLSIVTAMLPGGQVAGTYPETRLEVEGADGPVSWTVVQGALPPGLELDATGALSGTCRDQGVYEFDVAATDGLDTDVRRYTVAVDAFAFQMEGHCFGEIWAGEPMTLHALGAAGPVAFEVVTNESGGGYDRIDTATGCAVWIPGDATQPCRDTLRILDTTTGREIRVTMEIQPHPAGAYRAEFGSSDVWYVDDGARLGAHGLATDWDHVLQKLGLRGLTAATTTADRLASFYTRRAVLAELNRLFGRNPDGTRGDGLPISFPFRRPEAPYGAPAPGAWSAPSPDRYNVIGIVHGDTPSLLGMAFVDTQGNALIENDTSPSPSEDLGVFANQIAHTFNAAYQNNTLPANPLNEGDEAVLRDLIHGRPTDGLRAYLIQRTATGFAKACAMILAHEIGHSLGLVHTFPVQDGSIMNGGASIYPGAVYDFTEADLMVLRGGLPGPGRLAGASKGQDHVPALPPGGVSACRLRVVAGPCGCEHD